MDLDALQPVADRILDAYFESGLENLSKPDRVFFLIWAWGAALDGGGHAAFFYNSAADHYTETLAALNDLGLKSFAVLLESAARLLLSGEVSADVTERNRKLDSLPEESPALDAELDSLDRQYDELGGSDLALDTLQRWYAVRLTSN